MSKKSRTLKRARAQLARETGEQPDLPVTKARGPADLVSGIPYVLGFEPSESLVVMSLVGPRRRFGPLIRVDLVDESLIPLLIGQVMRLVVGHGWQSVVAIAYSEERSSVDDIMRPLTARLESADVMVFESLGVSAGRWWSYTCANPSCCPTQGTPFDASSSPVVTAMVASGMGKLASRDDLRAVVAPESDERRRSVAAACRLLEDTLTPAPDLSGSSPVMRRIVTDALDRDELDLATIAELLTMVQDLGHRDAAWMMMTRPDAADHFELWRQVMRVAPDDLLPPAGTLCAFAAWLSGHGVLAAHACERVAEVATEYSMLGLVQQALEMGVDPAIWARVEAARQESM
jgi:Domain of unknown function (DUF4192)